MNLKLSLILILASVLLTGCQKLIDIKAKFDSSGLVFYLKDKPSKVILRLYSIEVYKEDCESDCTYWQLETKYNKQGFKHYETIENFSIPYGMLSNKLGSAAPPKKLVPGKYTITADMSASGKYGNGVIYHFKIGSDEKGNLVVVDSL